MFPQQQQPPQGVYLTVYPLAEAPGVTPGTSSGGSGLGSGGGGGNTPVGGAPLPPTPSPIGLAHPHGAGGHEHVQSMPRDTLSAFSQLLPWTAADLNAIALGSTPGGVDPNGGMPTLAEEIQMTQQGHGLGPPAQTLPMQATHGPPPVVPPPMAPLSQLRARPEGPSHVTDGHEHAHYDHH